MTEDGTDNGKLASHAPPRYGPKFGDWALPMQLVPWLPPQAAATAMAADPQRRFASNPGGVVGSVATAAATAAVNGRTASARYWTQVALALVALADNPHVKVGAVLGDLAAKFNLA